jgi:hypothetical protein
LVQRQTWHSFRIFLATMLLESGASHAQIRALCRWQTDDSITIYARLNSLKYKALLDRAMAANVMTARANNLAHALPFIDISDVYAAADRQPLPKAPDLDADVHPDDDADDDDYEPDVQGDNLPGAASCAVAAPRAHTSRKATPTAVADPASPACRVVDVGDGETVSLATSDVLGLADVPVTLPDRLWAECSESRGSTRSTILGPLLRDSNTYAVLADGFVYLFPAADLIRFLPAIRLQHKPSANGSRQPLVLRGEGAQREVPMFC